MPLLLPSQIDDQLDRVLLRVQKPGRYVGGELNQVVKPWDSVSTRVALAFPDIYDLGLPNLGLAIFYQALNQRADCLAERTYLPWLDMESVMRQAGIPLYSLESKHALLDFDILAITLPYETLYTNTLNLLDLAAIPLHSKDRKADHPLVIAGGHATFNPEPMAEFIDAFVIGEGEEVIHEIIDAHRHWKEIQPQNRAALLLALASIPGVYVPSFYQPVYHPDGTIETYQRMLPTAPRQINKRILGKLPPPPTNFLVPNIEVVHNRVAVEIMRGCTRGCRFCHAGMINRPVRERPVEEIVHAIQSALDSTGFEEVALLSLSSSDYTQILELVEAISVRFTGKHLTVSLPSLRIESFSIDLMEHLKGSRQGGFTLAPEAATEKMRSIINKPISTEKLLETVRAIYSRGWLTIKLYFMIGHPHETLEDVEAIADLCRKVIAEGRKVVGHRANLNVGVSTFVPKPHTPFQWVPCDTPDKIHEKQMLLRRALKTNGVKLNWTDPKETLLEAWLSRGDRRLGPVIESAWRKGARFDAWQDQFNFQAWQEAFTENQINPDFFSHRQRNLDEVFPWDHINPGVRKSFLLEEYKNSLTASLRADCREQCYACGILQMFNELRRQFPGPEWKCPDVSPSSKQPSKSPVS